MQVFALQLRAFQGASNMEDPKTFRRESSEAGDGVGMGEHLPSMLEGHHWLYGEFESALGSMIP